MGDTPTSLKLPQNESFKRAVAIASISWLADVLGQKLFEKLSVRSINYSRAFKYACFRFITSHINDCWCDFTSSMLPEKSVYRRILLDQLIFDPISYALYYIYMCLLDKKGPKYIKQTLSNELLPSLKESWKFWFIIQLVNAKLIPQQLDALYNMCMSFLYDLYLFYKESRIKND
eukprot:Phypoly_transcript_15459.p1 GENE.Phypoly_transcript_15459~~Phypoly_transcript_15459.p1  ORF type:complete len:175 (+),score=0.12 Phypoly_transcript_15459:45-569(+)